MMDMHGRARLILDRFGHESGKTIVTQRGLADQTFEIKDLIGQLDRVAVSQVDL